MKFPFGTFNPTPLQTTAAAPPFPCEHFVVLLLSFYSYFYILQIHPNKHLGNSMRVHLIRDYTVSASLLIHGVQGEYLATYLLTTDFTINKRMMYKK